MTDAEFDAWYDDEESLLTVIVEVSPLLNGVPIPLYLATIGYTTYPTDTPASTPYVGVVMDSFKFTRALKLDLSGSASLSGGNVKIENPSGERDDWLTYMWAHRPIRAWVGDVRWPRADFRLIFDGVTANPGLGSESPDVLNILLRDKLEWLNTPLTEDKLGGETPNKDQILPVGFGELHNVTPLLVDPVNLEYQCGRHMKSIFRVRDNAIPVEITATPETGRFRLLQQPEGAITCCAQGDMLGGEYVRTVASTIERIVTSYGKASRRLTTDDIDVANFAAFDEAHPQPIGLYLSDRTNVLEACHKLAASVGAQISMAPTGLQLLKVELPPPGPVFELYQDMIVDGTLKLASLPPVKAAVKLGFCKNWTPQEGLQSSIPAQHLDLFATEWLTETAIDEEVQALYSLHADPVMDETQLVRRTDAAPEAVRQLDLWKVQRRVFEFTGYAPCLKLSLGQAIRIYNTRFNLSSGALGMVISLTHDWPNRRVVAQVLM